MLFTFSEEDSPWEELGFLLQLRITDSSSKEILVSKNSRIDPHGKYANDDVKWTRHFLWAMSLD